MEKVLFEKSEISDFLINYFKDKAEFITNIDEILRPESENDWVLALYDCHKALPDGIFEYAKILNLHLSLLPAFQTDNPLRDSFLAGVKVGGITIHYVEKNNFYGKIIAQYPVLIGNDTHFDQYCEEIKNIASKIYPLVIETVLNDKVFDFSDLIASQGCSGQCSGNCGNCKH